MKAKIHTPAVAIFAIAILAIGCCYWLLHDGGHSAPAAKQESSSSELFEPITLLPPAPPVTGFPVQSVREAGKELRAAELVLGITLGNEARSYPIKALNGAPELHIINDTLAGQPIAATW